MEQLPISVGLQKLQHGFSQTLPHKRQGKNNKYKTKILVENALVIECLFSHAAQAHSRCWNSCGSWWSWAAAATRSCSRAAPCPEQTSSPRPRRRAPRVSTTHSTTQTHAFAEGSVSVVLLHRIPHGSKCFECCGFVCAGSGQMQHSGTIPGRLLRQFTVFNVCAPSDTSLHTIYGKKIQLWLEQFPPKSVEHIHELSQVRHCKTNGFIQTKMQARTMTKCSFHEIRPAIHTNISFMNLEIRVSSGDNPGNPELVSESEGAAAPHPGCSSLHLLLARSLALL